MKNLHDVIIVGAGPIGLYLASKCEKEGLDYLLIEGSEEVGGQITHLYPEKEVVDLPNIASIKAQDWIDLLVSQLDRNKIILNSSVLDVRENDEITVLTAKTQYFCKKLVFATGLGTTTPRPLGIEHESECRNIIYNIKSFNYLKDKRVAIFGGGDSALDWAKHISAITNDAHLIHRRTEFRGNTETIKDCNNLYVHLPYIPASIEVKEGLATSVTIVKADDPNSQITIPVDYIFVNFGNISKQSNFPFPMTGSFLNVNENFEVSKNIFAIGDVAQYENKTRRMASGMNEADIVFSKIID